MNATPAFKDRASEFATDVALGAKVRGDWGAMYPNWYGKVTNGMRTVGGRAEYEIEWSDGTTSWYQIRATRSANGSPIGVWLI